MHEHVAMYGNVGCGKTMTVAYVVDYLRKTVDRSVNTDRPVVCSYFCKDDGNMSQARTMFRSLLSQLLTADGSLLDDFRLWYRDRKGEGQVNPTQSVDELRGLLVKLMRSLRQALYIVIDALDECDPISRNHLLDLIEQVGAKPSHTGGCESKFSQRTGRIRIFTSSRPDTEHSHSPTSTGIIQHRHNVERDLMIARHLADIYLAHLDIAVRNTVINTVGRRTEGSAIWARMTIQYVLQSKAACEHDIKDMLEKDLPGEVSELYARLFDKITNGLPRNCSTLARTLDVLAAARRQLTLEELTYAVCMEKDGRAPDTLLGIQVDCQRIYGLVRPFLSEEVSPRSIVEKSSSVRLVHQSLKDAIMRQSPSCWTRENFSGNASIMPGVREAELNGLALRLCVRYLLLQEFRENDLADGSRKESFDEVMFPFWDLPEDELLEDPESFHSPGGFYTYAACHWTDHFECVTTDYIPSVQDLSALGRPRENITGYWLRQPVSPWWFRIGVEFNPLSLVAAFGSEAALDELLSLGLPALGVSDETTTFQSAVWEAIRRERFRVVKVLLSHPSTTPLLHVLQRQKTFRLMSVNYTPSDEASWTEVMGLMLTRFRDVLIDYANLVLYDAAEAGNLLMVEMLFEAAKTDRELEGSLLQQIDDAYDSIRIAGLDDAYGPIGVAGRHGHSEVVRYLCEQPGMEVHLHDKNSHGENIYHSIACHGQAEVLRVLIRYFPEGVDESIDGHRTPVQDAISFEHLEAVRVLLLEGSADLNAGDPKFRPLQNAVIHGIPGMCRTLIRQGNADPWTIVGVSDIGLPFLHYQCQYTFPRRNQQEDFIREVCSLMPLALSIDDLWPDGSIPETVFRSQ